MVQKRDVVVVGGGPAGLAAAIAARQRGLSVVVADGARPPVDKPCGEGLMPETQAALRELGVEFGGCEGHHFRGIRFLQDGSAVAADLARGQGLGIRRPVLHAMLVRRAEEGGVELRWKTPVTGITGQGVRFLCEFVEARWIIGADGAGSRVRRWSGLDDAATKTLRYAVQRHCLVRPWSEYTEIYWGEKAQACVTPVGSAEVCIVVTAERPNDASLEAMLGHFPELEEKLAGAEFSGRERGATTYMHRLKRVWKGNVALVGDASGGVDAITGDGLRLAFRQALALAEAMQSGDLQHYQKAHRQLARRSTLMGNLLLLLGRDRLLRKRVMQVMAGKPELFGRIVAVHQGHATVAKMLSTGVMLGWAFLTA